MFFERIASFIQPPNTRSHGHPATRPHTHIRCNREVSYKAVTLAWLSLLLLLAASQRGAFLVPLTSSVYDTTAAARGINPILPTTAARLQPTRNLRHTVCLGASSKVYLLVIVLHAVMTYNKSRGTGKSLSILFCMIHGSTGRTREAPARQ